MDRSISPPPLRRQGHQLETGNPPSAIDTIPRAGTLRVFTWNVNGIAPFVVPYLRLRPQQQQESIRSFFRTDPRRLATGRKPDGEGEDESTPSLRRVLKRHAWPHVLFLQEVKIKHGDARTMDAVRAAVNDALAVSTISGRSDGGPIYEVYFNLPCDPHNAKGFGGKIYGVATVTRRDFSRAYIDTIRDVAWDKEGRVQVIETRGITFPFAIINIYAVNGTSNIYRSTDTGSAVGTRHDRKLAVHYELLREAKRLEDRGFAVVIAGDLNVARDTRDGHPNLRTWPRQHVLNRADFNDKFFSNDTIKSAQSGADRGGGKLTGFNGVDTFRSVHGDERRYSYYPRGRDWGTSCDRVDLIIASKALSGLLVDAGICDNPGDRGPSDHCPIWAEFGRLGRGLVGS
ncbi:DNase I-like protein [Xylariaceae sp. AK1471]|nr:DNase I-like protein [Xylariaceae sp. AK1471]